jgi:hypothetical protein
MAARRLVVPDLESLLIHVLVVAHPELVRISTDTTVSLQDELPVGVVEQVPGGGLDGLVITGVIDVHAFHRTRDGARDLAAAFWNDLHALNNRPKRTAVDSLVCTNAPHFVDYGDPKISRFLATYEVAARLIREEGNAP